VRCLWGGTSKVLLGFLVGIALFIYWSRFSNNKKSRSLSGGFLRFY
jgi:MFS superfamily sulfate permease-like transporter